MALVGNLKDLKLPSLIQLNCMERNTAKLTIENSGRYGFIYFDKGQLVHAEFDPDIGESAVFKLLTLYSGNFKVESGIRAPARTIHTNWNNLLLDGLHQLDALDEKHEKKYEHLFERLLTVKGVQSVVVIDQDGQVIAQSAENKNVENFLYLFSITEAEKMSATVSLEKPLFMSIAAAPYKYVIMLYNNLYVILEMDMKTKVDLVLPFIRQALGQKI